VIKTKVAFSLSAVLGLIADSVGRYALYVGAGGQGLWCVPVGSEPVQSTHDARHFIYIP